MIVAEKAVLHILDTGAEKAALSDFLLPSDEDVQSFLERHIEKCLKRASRKPGSFYEGSAFKKRVEAYVSDGDFLAFSKYVAELWFDVLRQAEDIVPSLLFVCDARVDDTRYIVLLRMRDRSELVHRAAREAEGLRLSVAKEAAVLPTAAQRVEESVLLSVPALSLFVSQQKYNVDGNRIFALSEAVLDCSLAPSQQEAMKAIRVTAEKVAEDFGQDAVATAASVKQAIAREMEAGEAIDPVKTGRAIFPDRPAMQEEFRQKLAASGFEGEKQIPVDREAVMKKVMNHRLRTDTGIELTIPVEYFDNTEYLEFNHEDDGSLRITLKHIGNITNKAF